MVKAKIFCSKKERKKVRRLHYEAATTPVIMIGNVDLSSSAWDRLTDYIKELAAKHKAPIGSGINTKTGEFVTQ